MPREGREDAMRELLEKQERLTANQWKIEDDSGRR
jgi:hypothetical protein